MPVKSFGLSLKDSKDKMQSGKPIIAIGVQFSSQARNIEAWEAEEIA
jgi:hypothetical protein